MEYKVSQEVLKKAIWYYENFGVVTQRATQLGRGIFRKLSVAMNEAGCDGIENAIEAELVLGNRDDYFEVIYDYDRFTSIDKVKEYVVKNNL